MTHDPPAASPALEYAPRPTARLRVLRRAVRLWPAWLLLILVGLGVAYGPRAWRHYQLLRLQQACMTAELPQDLPAFETNPAVAEALLRDRPAEYRRWGQEGWPSVAASRIDPRWADFAPSAGVTIRAGMLGGATAFLHERFTPSGARRLVVFEYAIGGVTVIEPATLFSRPRLLYRGEPASPDYDPRDPASWRELSSASSVGPAVADPNDRSRFVLPVWARDGTAASIECRLGDDDRVTLRFVSKAGGGPESMATAPWHRLIDAATAAQWDAALRALREGTPADAARAVQTLSGLRVDEPAVFRALSAAIADDDRGRYDALVGALERARRRGTSVDAVLPADWGNPGSAGAAARDAIERKRSPKS